ncbi:4a-hydroxytetrahydrobiopterin dehydratase [Sphingopyxis sp.]|uniref:4a-hydroxytetrahydrobiopterin dehydratase n=1 Tax=Sphingopyxis sp. TaxID=1908224 RepID=UPI001D7EC840|nr:4a-hydroxytetrahydrobiopterin dehydratase [Sphingopyxis sp.]MBW8296068.1 4a-hydroxytetrahydrobiopterin dehydratase [Sphingopyxis sp.]
MAHERQVRRLTAVEIEVELARLPRWSYDSGRRALHRRVELADFAAVFGLMARIAIAAEKIDHHPEWANVYNRLDIWLTTHDVDGVSPRDVALARRIDGFED